MQPIANIPILTHTGHKLTALEQAFINCYIISKNASQAVVEAGYKSKETSTKNISGWAGRKEK